MALCPEDIIVLSKGTKIYGNPSDLSISGQNEPLHKKALLIRGGLYKFVITTRNRKDQDMNIAVEF